MGHELGGWGEVGAPPEYDSGAPTGPAPALPTTVVEDVELDLEYPREVGLPVAVPAATIKIKTTKVMSGGEGTELPHWADPPTGEVPSALAGSDEDDMQAWHLLGSRGLHWRDDLSGWSDGPGVEDLVEEGDRSLMPDQSASDPFSFDEDFDRLERERARRTGPMPVAHPQLDAPGGGGSLESAGVGHVGARDSGAGATDGGQPAQTADQEAGEGAGEGYDPGHEVKYEAGDQGVQERGAILDVFPPSLAARRLRERARAQASQAARRAGTGSAGTGSAGTGRQERSLSVGEPAPSAEESQMARPASPAHGAANFSVAGRNGGPPGQPNGRRAQAPYDVNDEVATAGPGRNVGMAVVTGAVLVIVFVVCYLIGAGALVALSTVAILGCALEAFSMLQDVGFRPATLVGGLGSAGAVLAVYWKGTAALPVVVAVVLAATFLWYLARVVDARPVVNIAVTFLVFAWVGVMGSFAGLMLAANKGSHLFLGAVVPTVLCDVAAWFVGSRLGSHHLAPHTSPGKTWEGAIAGAIVAVVAGAVIGHSLSPWGGLRHGVELGVVIAVVAPIGDLVQSMVKRDLRLKDSGALLPGHGGLLDRFDSMLFVLPAVYFLAVALHLAG